MGQTILPMQAMKLLASSGVLAAAGAMISLTFAVSPPFTLLPPRQVAVAVAVNDNGMSQQTVGAAATETFGGSTESTDGIPPMPIPRERLDGLSSNPQMLSMPQEALQVTPRRDLLEGLIGGLMFVPPPMKLVEQQEPAAGPQPQQQGPTTAMAQEPPAQPSDVCSRHGLRRVYYNQNNHRYWRCAGRR
jgi:hypothetical protein